MSAIALSFGHAGDAIAEAFRIMQQGAAATAQSGAFAAQADDPSAIYYNPAGIARLNRVQLSAGTDLIGGHTSYDSPTSVKTEGNLDDDFAVPPPSHFYLTANLQDLGIEALENFSVGLGLTSPFGLRVSYPEDGPFSTAATFGSLPLLDIKPTIGYRLHDQLSIGFGVDIYTFADFLADGQTTIRFNSPGLPGLSPGTPLEINGSDTAVGFSFGLLYTPFQYRDGKPLVNVAFTYQSQARLHLQGEFLGNGSLLAGASTTLVLPQTFSGGIAVWPLRDAEKEWKVELDLAYAEWDAFKDLDVHLSNGGTLAFPQNWKNNYFLKAGSEYKWLQPAWLPDWDVALRAGYGYSETPVPDSTFSPLLTDSDLHMLSLGVGFTCHENGHFLGILPCSLGMGQFNTSSFGIDFAYQAMFYEPRTISGNLNPTVDGTYRTLLHLGAITFRLSF